MLVTELLISRRRPSSTHLIASSGLNGSNRTPCGITGKTGDHTVMIIPIQGLEIQNRKLTQTSGR